MGSAPGAQLEPRPVPRAPSSCPALFCDTDAGDTVLSLGVTAAGAAPHGDPHKEPGVALVSLSGCWVTNVTL